MNRYAIVPDIAGRYLFVRDRGRAECWVATATLEGLRTLVRVARGNGANRNLGAWWIRGKPMRRVGVANGAGSAA